MKNNYFIQMAKGIMMFLLLSAFSASAQTSIVHSEVIRATPEADSVSRLVLKVSDPAVVHIVSIHYLKDNKESTSEVDVYYVVTEGNVKYLVSEDKNAIPLTAENMSFILRKKETTGFVSVQVVDSNFQTVAVSELIY